jgi:hypothetical protein
MSALEILFRDAAGTAGRIKRDALHLRELGARAKVAAAMAHVEFRKRVDMALGKVADGVLEVERQLGKRGGK